MDFLQKKNQPIYINRRHRDSRPVRRAKRILALILLVIAGSLVLTGVFFGRRIRYYHSLKKAYTLCQENKFDPARKELNKAVSMRPDEPLTHDVLGFFELCQGNMENAKADYAKAVGLGLKYSRSFDHGVSGWKFIRQGKYPKSKAEFEHALELQAQKPDLLYGLGLSQQGAGLVNDAITSYKKALAIAPQNKEIQKDIDAAKRAKSSGVTVSFFDRKMQPLVKHSTGSESKIIYAGGGIFTAQLIGFDNEVLGKTGLMEKMSDFLPGNQIMLTLDLLMQKHAEWVLDGHKGAVVILNPKTGEILAAVSHPTFDPNRLTDTGYRHKIKNNANHPMLNRAFEELYEPGSIFKMITAVAAIETGLDLKKVFPLNCKGYLIIDRHTFWDWRPHKSVASLEEAFDYSCNTAFAELGFNLGADILYEYAGKFGFNTPLGLQLPSAESTVPLTARDKLELANYSTGLGENVRITPLMAALLASAVANNGKIMKPFLVREVRNIQGEVIWKTDPAPFKTAMKPETARQITVLMLDAVNKGIGKKARVKGISVAGKTGTSGERSAGFNGWFIGFAPAENPQIAIAVIAENSGTGMDVAAPIAGQIIERILKSSP